jgi:hypothetical protein
MLGVGSQKKSEVISVRRWKRAAFSRMRMRSWLICSPMTVKHGRNPASPSQAIHSLATRGIACAENA